MDRSRAIHVLLSRMGDPPSRKQAHPAPCHATYERELVNLPSCMLPPWQARLYDVKVLRRKVALEIHRSKVFS